MHKKHFLLRMGISRKTTMQSTSSTAYLIVDGYTKSTADFEKQSDVDRYRQKRANWISHPGVDQFRKFPETPIFRRRISMTGVQRQFRVPASI